MGYCKLDLQEQPSAKFLSKFIEFHLKMHFNMLSVKLRPFCLGPDVLTSPDQVAYI